MSSGQTAVARRTPRVPLALSPAGVGVGGALPGVPALRARPGSAAYPAAVGAVRAAGTRGVAGLAGVLAAEEGGRRDPFAPPSPDAPPRPWQPRLPQDDGAGPAGSGSGSGSGSGAGGGSGPGSGSGQGGSGQGQGQGGPGHGGSGRPGSGSGRPPRGDRPQVPPPHPWSPGWQGGQLGRRPGEGPGGQGPWGPVPPQGGPQPRFDPTDPAQRRARYALLGGMWGIFFFILGVPYLTLLLGALGLYWSISALRAKPRPPQTEGAEGGPADAPKTAQPGPATPARRPVPPAAPSSAPQVGAPVGWGAGYQPVAPLKPQVPAAMGGLLAAVISLGLVGAYFAVHLVYRSYFDCMNDALTQGSQSTCSTLLPEPLRSTFSQTFGAG